MSGLLAGIYSAGDRMKRKLGGLLSNPLETVALGSTRMAEDTNALSRLASEAGYMPNTVNRADQSVLVSERQKALARALLADKGAEMGMAAATVWHGSPHKFDKFDSSKIGTGEGAQAYGHGLYLAENPGVAKAYKKNLSQGRAPLEVSLDGAPFPAPTINYANPDPKQQQLARIRTLLLQEGGDVDRAIARTYGDDAAALAQFRGRVAVGEPGNLYKVDLPDNAIARMLDWDKPLSQQAELLDALRKSKSSKVRKTVELLGDVNKPLQSYGQDLGLLTGKDLIERLGYNFDGKATSAAASLAIKNAGIPGVRYLDGGSRGAGQGSSNFVIFPGQEDILTILERNGVPIK